MSLRFAFLVDVLEIGGIQRQLSEVCRALVNRGDSVTVVSMRGDDMSMAPTFEKAGARVESFHRQKRFDFKALGKLRNFLTHRKFDIVHAMSPQMAFWAALLSPAFRKFSLIGSVLNTFFFQDRLSVFAEKFVTSRRLNAVLVNSKEAKANYRKAISQSLPIVCIYNGVRIPAPAKSKTQKSPIVISSIGRLSPVKGHDVLISSLSKLPKDARDWKLILAGDGPSKNDLQILAKQLKIDERIEFRGSDHEPEKLLETTDIFVLPSQSEGLPNALLEAMAAGLPCVATAVGGIPEISRNGKGYLLVPPNDPAALADSIFKIMTDHQLSRQLGQIARKTVSRKFSMNKMIKHTLAFYDRVHHRNTGRTAQ